MKRRNFFKSLAAIAVIPILPQPKEEYKFVSKPSLKGNGYLTGMWTPTGPITYPYSSGLYGEFAGKEVKHYNFPRHGVNSIEYINRNIK